MIPGDPDEDKITEILSRLSDGKTGAGTQLYGMVYDQLKSLARGRLSRESRRNCMQTTALVHEAYLKLSRSPGFENRRHFFGAAGRAMQRVLVDQARRALAQKRAGQEVSAETVPLPAVSGIETAADLIDLDDAIEALGEFDERKAEVVRCRVFLELTTAETAAALEVSTRTIENDWKGGRAWIRAFIDGEAGPTRD